MKCSSCGRNLPPETHTCPYCGGEPEKGSSRRGAHAAQSHISIKKLLLLIPAAFLALALLALLLYYSIILPRKNYRLAAEAMGEGHWQDAATIYSACTYKDSQSLYYYCAGMYRYSQEAWADAAAYFAQSEKPAPDGVYAYCLAMDAMDRGLWSEAAQLFSLTDNYSRSAEMRAVCLALAAREEGDYLAAMESLPEGERYAQVYSALGYSARYDLVFIETLTKTLEDSFVFAADMGSDANLSDALDGVYYAFYDIYTTNSDNFKDLFNDKRLASYAAQYISASLRQWSLTGYNGRIIPGCEEEYFSLAAQRRSLVAKIDRLYPLELDRDALNTFISQANTLRTFYRDYVMPLQSYVESALEKPEKHDGSYWLSLSADDEALPESLLETVFCLRLEFLDRDGKIISTLDCDELGLIAGDSLLVCLNDYGTNVKSTRVFITPVSLIVSGNRLLSAWTAI